MPKPIIMNFEDFKKIELKTAKILEAEKIEGSDKMVKLKIELGDEERQILAGVGKVYSIEELVGKTIVVVSNLEPKELMGIESQSMLLAAGTDEGPVLLTCDKDVPSGLKIK